MTRFHLTYGPTEARNKTIPDINVLRRAIAEEDPSGDLAFRAVAIWAPHTHWPEDKQYLIEEMHPQGYFLRASADKPDDGVLGISFAIQNGEIIPCEYGKRNVLTPAMLEEYPAIMQQLRNVAKKLGNCEAGFTLTHRFRKDFDARHVQTTEHEATDEGTLITASTDEAGFTERWQPVIWTAFDPYLYTPKFLHPLLWIMFLGRKDIF